MTFTVDDLVTSFSAGGHIGQEAIDIANLQAQLSQTLAYAQQQQQQQQQQQYASSTHGLCNTPTTARTPTTSFANWSVLEQQHRTRSRSASAVEGMAMTTVGEDSAMDADDELAVEQLLAPAHAQALSSPVRCRGRGETFYTQQSYAHTHAYAHPPPSPSHTRYAHAGADPMSMSDCTSPVSSSFAASDPFFAAAAAEAQGSARQSQHAQSSFFAQIGLPSQHSPFYAAAQGTGSTSSQTQFGAARFVAAGTVDS